MPTKHWSTNVNQVIVQRGSNGSFNLCIEGGSEYGQFVVIGDVLTGILYIIQCNEKPLQDLHVELLSFLK